MKLILLFAALIAIQGCGCYTAEKPLSKDQIKKSSDAIWDGDAKAHGSRF